MDAISLTIAIAELAIWAIILWFVCEYIGVPTVPKRAVQLLIVLIAILSSIKLVVAGTPSDTRHSYISSPTPSIMAPEKTR